MKQHGIMRGQPAWGTSANSAHTAPSPEDDGRGQRVAAGDSMDEVPASHLRHDMLGADSYHQKGRHGGNGAHHEFDPGWGLARCAPGAGCGSGAVLWSWWGRVMKKAGEDSLETCFISQAVSG